ncbi:hypothetical protein VKT23_019845 [Stygiomarasmius scandens]|uniref:HMG box protein n=1 Tax=Marasmiellus scandens TaxID=2682957 RepID=A0ABR1INN8_9AGAR
MERMLSAARSAGTSLRKPWRHRTKRIRLKLTNAEKRRQKAARDERREHYQDRIRLVHKLIYDQAMEIREELGNRTVEQIVEDIMQTHRLKRTQRKASRFNAFVRVEMRRRNADTLEGEDRQKVDACIREIADKWQEMSDKERKAATDEALQELNESRENRFIGRHNSAISAFHDARTTLSAIKLELQRLNARTGVESVVISVRSNLAHFLRPDIFVTSDRVPDYFNMAFKQPLVDIAQRLEGYIISGVEGALSSLHLQQFFIFTLHKGVVRNHQRRLLDKKSELCSLVKAKLQECVGRNIVSRMYYVNFAERITRTYRVIVRNWPLPKFCSPSELKTMVEVDLLFNAWQSGTTYFYKMSSSEFEAWEQAGFDSAMTITLQQTASAEDVPTEPLAISSPSDGNVTSGSADPSSIDPTSVTPSTARSEAVTAPLTTNFVNNMVVGGVDGQTVFVTAKKRAKRKDAGVPRGPRKKARTGNENAPA